MAGPGGLTTPFDNAVFTDPTGDFAAKKGGFDLPSNGDNPVTTAFDNAVVAARSDIGETANGQSGLPMREDLIQVDGAPAAGAAVSPDSVYAPGIPSGTFGAK